MSIAVLRASRLRGICETAALLVSSRLELPPTQFHDGRQCDDRYCIQVLRTLCQVQTHTPTEMTEQFEAVPFQEPSPQLFELFGLLESAYDDLCDVMLVEFQHEELLSLTELSNTQIDCLLTQGKL
jgi:hypothetical protein